MTSYELTSRTTKKLANRSQAITLSKVSKSYHIQSAVRRNLLNFLRRGAQADAISNFEALTDIDLEIPSGIGIGILGLNGAGKSTLLKIIAGQIMPTKGIVKVSGRVQFLELGAGFSLDRSARQNVVAAAQAEGLSRSEISERLEYVESFADIGIHFDQKMKTYSSGMCSRVAFANALVQRPDILIVDEALAVGDAVFANKCARKIAEVRAAGTTFIFTSHSTEAVLNLCEQGIVLHKGKIVALGDAKTAVNAYKRVMNKATSEALGITDNFSATAKIDDILIYPDRSQTETFSIGETFDGKDRTSDCTLYNNCETIRGSGGARIVGCTANIAGKPAIPRQLSRGEILEITLCVLFEIPTAQPQVGFEISDPSGILYYGANQLWLGQRSEPAQAGELRYYRIKFPLTLAGGHWFISIGVADGMRELQVREAVLNIFLTDVINHTGRGWLDATFEEIYVKDS